MRIKSPVTREIASVIIALIWTQSHSFVEEHRQIIPGGNNWRGYSKVSVFINILLYHEEVLCVCVDLLSHLLGQICIVLVFYNVLDYFQCN